MLQRDLNQSPRAQQTLPTCDQFIEEMFSCKLSQNENARSTTVFAPTFLSQRPRVAPHFRFLI